MSEISLLALAFGLGLLGFIEPCSIGANGIFLGSLREKDRGTRLLETIKFTLARSLILALFGLGIALLGSFIFTAQQGFWLFLGLLYLALGMAIIVNTRFRLGLFSRLSPSRLTSRYRDHSLGMGLLFGLNLPACTYPLIVVLLGGSAALGAAWGFIVLFVFGMSLSLPLIPLARSERAAKALERLTRFSGKTPYVIGLALLAISAYVLYTATPYFDITGGS
jgi:cytochrome c-type biogenesis protein